MVEIRERPSTRKHLISDPRDVEPADQQSSGGTMRCARTAQQQGRQTIGGRNSAVANGGTNPSLSTSKVMLEPLDKSRYKRLSSTATWGTEQLEVQGSGHASVSLQSMSGQQSLDSWSCSSRPAASTSEPTLLMSAAGRENGLTGDCSNGELATTQKLNNATHRRTAIVRIPEGGGERYD